MSSLRGGVGRGVGLQALDPSRALMRSQMSLLQGEVRVRRRKAARTGAVRSRSTAVRLPFDRRSHGERGACAWAQRALAEDNGSGPVMLLLHPAPPTPR